MSEEYVEFDPPALFTIKTEEAAKLRDIVAAPPFDESYKALKAYADSVLGDKPDPLKKSSTRDVSAITRTGFIQFSILWQGS